MDFKSIKVDSDRANRVSLSSLCSQTANLSVSFSPVYSTHCDKQPFQRQKTVQSLEQPSAKSPTTNSLSNRWFIIHCIGCLSKPASVHFRGRCRSHQFFGIEISKPASTCRLRWTVRRNLTPISFDYFWYSHTSSIQSLFHWIRRMYSIRSRPWMLKRALPFSNAIIGGSTSGKSDTRKVWDEDSNINFHVYSKSCQFAATKFSLE